MALEMKGGKIDRTGLVLGGMAPNPWRATEGEQLLTGADPASIDPAEVAAAVISRARPLRGNRYKVDLAENLVKRAIGTLLTGRN